MEYEIGLKDYLKELDTNPLYINKYISAKVDAYNDTKFQQRILKDNKHRDILIKPKNGSLYEYLSIILLDSILFYQNKHHPQIFFKK